MPCDRSVCAKVSLDQRDPKLPVKIDRRDRSIPIHFRTLAHTKSVSRVGCLGASTEPARPASGLTYRTAFFDAAVNSEGPSPMQLL